MVEITASLPEAMDGTKRDLLAAAGGEKEVR
jgi:hypothetical protein